MKGKQYKSKVKKHYYYNSKGMFSKIPHVYNPFLTSVSKIDPRDIKIQLPMEQLAYKLQISDETKFKRQLSNWLVVLYQTICSNGFICYHNGELSLAETKNYCAKNILFNIQNLTQQLKNMQRYRKKWELFFSQESLFKYIDQQSKLIIAQLILKYPQASGTSSVRKLKKIVQRPNNIENDQFDLLRDPKICGVKFQYKRDGDYTEEIMRGLNYIINITHESFDKFDEEQKTNIEAFESLLQSIYSATSNSDTEKRIINNLQKFCQVKKQDDLRSSTNLARHIRLKRQSAPSLIPFQKLFSNQSQYIEDMIKLQFAFEREIQEVKQLFGQVIQLQNFQLLQNIYEKVYERSDAKQKIRILKKNKQQIQKILTDPTTSSLHKRVEVSSQTKISFGQKQKPNQLQQKLSEIYDRIQQIQDNQSISNKQQQKENNQNMNVDKQNRKRKQQLYINQKVPSNTPLFTQQEINNKDFKIKDSSVLRIITKWAQQLRQKLSNAKQLIMDRYQFFKTNDGEFIEVNTNLREELYRAAIKQEQQIANYFEKINQQSKKLEEILFRQNFKGKFSNTIDTNTGILATKVQAATGQYMLSYLNKIMNSLFKLVKQAKQIKQVKQSKLLKQSNKQAQSQIKNLQLSANYDQQQMFNLGGLFQQDDFLYDQEDKIQDKYEKYDKQKNISLITFKIGDIMRARFKSSQKNVIKFYQLLSKLDNHYPQLVRIIRLKDRLNSKDKDLLLNFHFNKKIQCELQLSVVQELDRKEQQMNNFNHFLYQLKRTKLGLISQCACIVGQYDPVVKNYCQRANLDNLIVKEKKKPEYLSRIQQTRIKQFPFICSNCESLIINGRCYQKQSKMQEICINCYVQQKQKEKQITFTELFKEKKYQLSSAKHLTLIDLNKMSNQQDLIDIKYGFLINKKALVPKPIYFEIQEFQNYVYIVSENLSNNQNSSLPKTTIYKINPQQFKKNQWKQKLSSKLLLFAIDQKNAKLQLKNSNIQKKSSKIVLQCKNQCCQRKIQFNIFDSKSEILENYNKIKIKQGRQQMKEVFEGSNNKELIQQIMKSEIKPLSKVKKLYLEKDEIDEFQINKIIEKFSKQLTILRINDNKLTSLTGLRQCAQLKQLNCGGNRLISLYGLDKFTMLEQLDISNNQLSSLHGLNKCTQLKILDCRKNRLSSLQGLDKFTELQQLNCCQNMLTSLNGLQFCSHIEQLNCGKNKLTSLHQLSQFSQLQQLDCTGNQLTCVKGIQKCSQLNRLNCAQNKIITLKELEQCVLLQELNCGWNNLSSLRGLVNCIQLKQIDCAGNKLTSLAGIEKCLQLRIIDCGPNRLSSIQQLKKCTQLKQLDLSANRLNSLEDIENLIKLQSIKFQKNNFIKNFNILLKTHYTRLKQLTIDKKQQSEQTEIFSKLRQKGIEVRIH